MKRPSKKEIQTAVEKLKDAKPTLSKPSHHAAPLEEKKTSMRIRKQGI